MAKYSGSVEQAMAQDGSIDTKAFAVVAALADTQASEKTKLVRSLLMSIHRRRERPTRCFILVRRDPYSGSQPWRD